MSYDKAVEELISIVKEGLDEDEEIDIGSSAINFELMRDKFGDFLKRFEEGCIEANTESIRENLEPAFDMHDLD